MIASSECFAGDLFTSRVWETNLEGLQWFHMFEVNISYG